MPNHPGRCPLPAKSRAPPTRRMPAGSGQDCPKGNSQPTELPASELPILPQHEDTGEEGRLPKESDWVALMQQRGD